MQFRARRPLTTFEVNVHCEAGDIRASILDVTASGARLRLDADNLTPDSRLSFSIRGESIPAHVVWNKNGEAGVMFDEILPVKILATINQKIRRSDPTSRTHSSVT